jgi:hypothetical protein
MGVITMVFLSGCATSKEFSDPVSGTQEIKLGNDTFAVTVLLRPDYTTGMREEFGPRFDQTALVQQVRLKGQTFLYEPWRLVDEFGINGKGVLGYDSAVVGDQFIKIGVGVLKKDENNQYRFSHQYPVGKLAEVTVTEQGEQAVTVEQSAELGPWGYRYTKRYFVEPDQATLRIEYSLKNTGQKAYPLEQYNHNWFHFSGTRIGPGYILNPTLAIERPSKKQKWFEWEGGIIRITEAIQKGSYFPSVADSPEQKNRLVVRYEGGAGVIMKGNFPVERFALFADERALCPEVFYGCEELAPGATARWQRTYRFDLQF